MADKRIDWTLLVGFENGRVKSKQITYTCLYRTPPEMTPEKRMP
jgi:hypothetical protein